MYSVFNIDLTGKEGQVMLSVNNNRSNTVMWCRMPLSRACNMAGAFGNEVSRLAAVRC